MPKENQPPSPMGNLAYSVVVSSCDGYRDLWPYFFHFYFRCAPALPQPVYLVSNFTRYADERVRTILTGPDRHWGDSLARGLAEVQTEWVLYLQDDYLLSADVDEARLHDCLTRLGRLGGQYLSLLHRRDDGPLAADGELREIPQREFFADLQAGFWRRETLLKVVCPHSSPWRGESAIRALAKAGEVPGYYCLPTEVPPLLAYVEAVRGKFWRPGGLSFLQAHGLVPDLRFRPYPPQGQEWWAKGLRSWHKRRMALREAGRALALGWSSTLPVQRQLALPSIARKPVQCGQPTLL